MLGEERLIFRVNDDGEPSGTAGKPILGQINSHQLTNILIIVVRYFGGVLLGTGGLMVAYRQAAADALNQAEIIEKTVDCYYHLAFEYQHMNNVMRILKEENTTIIKNDYNTVCQIDVCICKANEVSLISKLKKIDGITLTKCE